MAHYMNQEGTYVHRLTQLADEHDTPRQVEEDELQEPIPPPDLVLNLGSYDEHLVKERTEWQAMLSNVLTGEVFQAEKSRLKVEGRDSRPILQLWTELKAKVACRSLSDQRRVLAVGRGHTHEVLDRILHFKPLPPPATIHYAFAEIGALLTLLDRCESLWPNLRAMRDYFPVYGSTEFSQRAGALSAWYTVVQQLLQELDLLKKWTGNALADPTLPAAPEVPTHARDDDDARNDAHNNDAHVQTGSAAAAQPEESLVEVTQKQEGALRSIFEQHIEVYLFPLVARARECMEAHAAEFEALNLPPVDELVQPLLRFAIKLVQESMETRLAVAAKMYGPNTVLIDEVVLRFEMYLSLGLKLAQNCIRLGEHVQKTSLNDTMLRIIRFYLELLSNKFLDGGQSSMSFFRSFKNIEQLDGHFNFLQVTCQLIEGGDISVAEQFSSLHLRILTRLLAYWEHQMGGPRQRNKMDVERWFADTCENIRGIHRKLMRFYRTLCNTYENASEFTVRQDSSMKDVLGVLHDLGYALVLSGERNPNGPTSSGDDNNINNNNSNDNNVAATNGSGTSSTSAGTRGTSGTYAFASPSLRKQPLVVHTLLQGHSRPPLSNTEPGAIVLLSVKEQVSWTGPVLQLETTAPILYFPGQVRLVAQGGYPELQYFQKQQPRLFEEVLLRTIMRKSQLTKVELELHRMRAVWLKLMLTVLQSAIKFRRQIRAERRRDCTETVQIMMAFAHDFGERSLRLIPEVNRGKIVLKMFEFCLEWLDFVVDDCPPGDSKRFKWTVTALEFAMKMTRGVNVLALPESKFSRLRSKVADCMAILIAHYDIMGARSKAANLTNHNNRVRLQQIRGGMGGAAVVAGVGSGAAAAAGGGGGGTAIAPSEFADVHADGFNAAVAANALVTPTPISPNMTSTTLNAVNNTSDGVAAALKDDDEVIAAHRVSALEKFDQLEARKANPATHGKILDQNNTEFEFLSFASSPFTAAAMRWQRAEPIGSGSFGSVFRAHSLDDFQVMAVKEVRISLTQSISKVLKNIKDEMNVLEIVSHPNIVQYYGVEVHRERVYIFMEYCPQGSLAEMLQYGQIDDEMIVQFFSLQILEGLAYLHDIGIVHRDIKPANILLKNNFIKIVDFGAAKIIANNGNVAAQTQIDATKGTPMYMAPEVINREPSASLPSVDIWSLGCVMMQMVTGQLPWSDCDNIYSILYCIGKNRMPTIPDDESISPECRELLVSCLQRDPAKRLTAMELLRNPWFDSARETLNQFLEMPDHELDFVESPNNPPSSVDLLNTQELYQQQQQQQQLQQQQQQQQLQQQQQQQQQHQYQQQVIHEHHESIYPPEQVSGYDQQQQHLSSSEGHTQVTPMEPIAESDMEYENQR